MGKLTEKTSEQQIQAVAGSQARMKAYYSRIKNSTFWDAAKDEIRATFNIRNTMATLAVLMLATVGITTAHGKVAGTETVYRVYIDGQYHGLVRDKALIEETITAFGDKVKANIEFQEVHQAVISTQESYVAQAIEDSTKTIVDMMAIRVDGVDVAYVKDAETAEKIVGKLKGQFVKSDADVKVAFAEQVDFVAIKDDKSKILAPDAAYSLIVQGKNEKKTYVVSRGDSLWTIAEKNKVTVEELQQANPDVHNADEIQEGQSLNLTAYEPLINVFATYDEEREIMTNYEIEYKEDDSLPKGQEKVLEPGEEGKKKQTVRVRTKNGAVMKEEVLAETVITEPKKEVVAKGTKISAGAAYYNGPVAAAGGGDWAWPIGGGYVSSHYGENRGGRPHFAIDIAAATGTPVYASNSGTVIQAGDAGDGYGNCIIISHGNGITTLYGHLNSMSVYAGQTVQKGQYIGGVGSTGWSTGAHLHYEARINGTKVNPAPYM